MGFYTNFEPPESAKARRRPATSAKAASERRHIRSFAAQRQQIPVCSGYFTRWSKSETHRRNATPPSLVYVSL